MYFLGGYTFHHEDLEPDRLSVVSTKSEKEAAEYYERELRLKLIENFVGPETKEDQEELGDNKETSGPQKNKKTNSLKRIFSRKGK